MSEELKIAFEQMSQRGSNAGGASVAQRALADPRVRRGQRRPIFAAATALVATIAVVVAGVVVVRSRVPHIERVNVGGALTNGDGFAGTTTALLIGTDGQGLDDNARRADTIMLLRVNAATGSVSLLSLPRDLYVPIAGTTIADRLATASRSGPSTLIETVRALTGISVDHYLEFDFEAFRKVVDAAGGVDLPVPARMRDELAGLDLPAGCAHLDGNDALAYVRARHVLIQDAIDGRYRADPTGDAGRVQRQQHLFLIALDQIVRARDFVRIERIANVIEDHVRVDHTFSFRDAVDLARKSVDAIGHLNLLTYPSVPARLDNGAAVLEPDTTQAASVIEAFNNPPDIDDGNLRDAPPAGVSC